VGALRIEAQGRHSSADCRQHSLAVHKARLGGTRHAATVARQHAAIAVLYGAVTAHVEKWTAGLTFPGGEFGKGGGRFRICCLKWIRGYAICSRHSGSCMGFVVCKNCSLVAIASPLCLLRYVPVCCCVMLCGCGLCSLCLWCLNQRNIVFVFVFVLMMSMMLVRCGVSVW